MTKSIGKTKDNSAKYLVSLPTDYIEQIDRLCERNYLSRSALLTLIIKDFLDNKTLNLNLDHKNKGEDNL